MKLEQDNVNHPSHYTDGSIEVLDFIEDKTLNYHRGNAIKYICRAGKKSKETEEYYLKGTGLLPKRYWFTN